MSKYKNHDFENKDLSFKKLLKRCLIVLLASILIGILITLLFSLVFYNLPDPTSRINIASLLSMYFTVFISGFILSRVNKQKYFIGSLILGLMLFAINIILSIILKDELSTTDYIWKLLIPVFCILGSMIGIKKERKSYRKKRFLR